MSSEIIFETVEKSLLSTSTKPDLFKVVLLIGYYLLGLINLEDTLRELTELGVADQYNFLKSIEKTLRNVNMNLNTEIAEAEAALKSLGNNATNELNKIEEEKIYPSQQADLIQTKNTPPPTSPPRWESES
jgi:hypothetical protein